LTVFVTGQALAALPRSRDALVRGTSFHASASIPCVANPCAGPELKPCEAFVTRRAGGAATVEIPRGQDLGRRA
jgi:hypothetical protein